MNYTEELSRFVARARTEDFPQEVRDAAKKALLDWIGVTLAAAGEPAAEILLGIIDEMGGRKQASILGYGRKTTMLAACLMNGTLAHILDFDDAHGDIRTHPSAPMVPAVLALGEYREMPGTELIAAIVAGFEVTVRLGYALGSAYYEKGWHGTAILGRFGAAAAAARVLGLDAQRTSIALGLAATQAGGLRDVFGTMGKPFHSGKAAMDGLLAAMLAGRGFSAPPDMLRPGAGFARVITDIYDSDAIVAPPGNGYLIVGGYFKPYAACLFTHAVIDGLLTLRKSHGFNHASIKEVRIRVAPMNMRVAGNMAPKDATEAKFSVAAAAGLAIIHGRATEGTFSDKNVRDPELQALIKRLRITTEAGLGEQETFMEVVLSDGRCLPIHVTNPKGDPKNPMSFDEVAEKMRDLSEKAVSARAAGRIVEMVKRLEEVDNIARLVRLCALSGRRKAALLP